MDTSTFKQVFRLFYGSDPRLWVRLVPVRPLRAAYYHDVELGPAKFHRFLLHLAESSERVGFYRVALEIGSHSSGRRDSLIFDAMSTCCEIPLETFGSDLADAKWPLHDDPFVRKAHEVVVSCRHRLPISEPGVENGMLHFH